LLKSNSFPQQIKNRKIKKGIKSSPLFGINRRRLFSKTKEFDLLGL
jgi:hypothetical protein